MPKPYDVVIIGGGASGLAAAICAAQTLQHHNKPSRVAILEADISCGKKILATGNGRCNVSNVNLDASHYSNPVFTLHVMQQAANLQNKANSSVEDLIGTFFDNLGLLTTLQDDRYYPLSMRAESVRDVLLETARRLNITLLCNHTVSDVKYKNDIWHISAHAPATQLIKRDAEDDRKFKRRLAKTTYTTKNFSATSVIFAAGNPALENDSYLARFAADNHVALVAPQPVLCPISCVDTHHDLATLDAMRIICTAHLLRDSKDIYAETGEVLFRTYGLSGVCVFNLSRRTRSGDIISLNLLPNFSEKEIAALLRDRVQTLGFDNVLTGIFGSRIAQCLYTRAASFAKDHHLDAIDALAHTICHFNFEVISTYEHKQAQVMRGGIDTHEISSQDLSLSLPGAFVCGEIIDVDADCGGFNLAWAWTSGLLAGFSAATYAS